MHRTDIDDDGANTLAGETAPSSGPPLGPTVIPFPRDRRDASVDLAAGGDPPSSPAPFESLGAATQAVVMRLANKRIRVNVLVSTPGGEEEQGRDQS